MSTAPVFILSATPFGSGRDPLAITLHVHRVTLPREPQYGVLGRLLEPTPTVTLAELLAEVERLALGLGARPRPTSPEAEPRHLPVLDGRIVFPEVPS